MLFRSKEFVDGTFIDMDIYKIGEYVVSYSDGSEAAIDVVYGGNITNEGVNWERKQSDGTDSYKYDNLLKEVTSRTLPVKINEKTYCRFIAQNPYPEKVIQGISVKTAKEGYGIYPDTIRLL